MTDGSVDSTKCHPLVFPRQILSVFKNSLANFALQNSNDFERFPFKTLLAQGFLYIMNIQNPHASFGDFILYTLNCLFKSLCCNYSVIKFYIILRLCLNWLFLGSSIIIRFDKFFDFSLINTFKFEKIIPGRQCDRNI